jgi:hypothetical protein
MTMPNMGTCNRQQHQCEAGTHSLSHTYNRGNGVRPCPARGTCVVQASVTMQPDFTCYVDIVDTYKGLRMAPDTVDILLSPM